VLKLHSGNQTTADAEYSEMYQSIKAEITTKSRSLSDLWATRAMTRRTFVAIGVQIFTQLTGINGESNY
jgi:hypothetical protein